MRERQSPVLTEVINCNNIVLLSVIVACVQGVVHTYGSLDSQMCGMIEAWRWTSADVILHVLPLHHVHGLVNVLMTPLYCGATCVMMPKYDSHKVCPQVFILKFKGYFKISSMSNEQLELNTFY